MHQSFSGTFVGRAAERAELQAGLDHVLQGHGRLFLITGEPGIGKTRLAEQLAMHAEARSALVAWGRCWEGGGAPAYWPWIQIFRSCLRNSPHWPSDLMPDKQSLQVVHLIPEMLEDDGGRAPRPPTVASDNPEQERFRFFDSAAQLLKRLASTGPLVIFVDDLQAADEPSLQMLVFVARQLKGDRVLLVGTYRDNEIQSSPVVSRLFANLVREGTQLPLRGLGRSEIDEYLNQHAAFHFDRNLIDSLWQVTDGNALFLDGIVRMLRAQGEERPDHAISAADFTIPHGLREAIRARLNRLTNDANELLRIGSVIGKEFGLRAIQRIESKSQTELLKSIDELTRDGILSPMREGQLTFRFAHDLIRETIYRDILTADRLRLHERVAKVIEDIHQSNLTPHLTDLAYHYRIAAALGNSVKAIDYSIRAGEAALAVCAYEETAVQWKIAIALLEQQDNFGRQTADLLFRLGRLAATIDRPNAIGYLETALGLYEKLGERVAGAQVHAGLGNFMSTVGPDMDVQRALDHYHRGDALLRGAPQSDSAKVSALINSGLAAAATRAMRIKEGMTAARRAMKIARKLKEEPLLARAAAQYSLHLFHSGRLAGALSLIERVWKKADSLNNGKIAFSSAWIGGGCYAALYDFRQADLWYGRELSKPRTRNAQHMREILSVSLAVNAVQTGQANRALTAPYVGVLPILLPLAQGRWEEADTRGTEGYKNSRQVGGRDEGNRICVYPVARARRILGRYSEAEAFLKEAISICTDEPLESVEMWVRPELALLYADMNDIEKAVPHIVRCRQILSEGEDWRGLVGEVARAEAVVGAANANFAYAERKFEEALGILHRYSVCLEEAETLYCWGRALNAAGEQVRAAEKFDAAIEVYRRCGAGERWIKRALAAKQSLQSTSLARTPGAADQQATFRKQDDSWIISFAGKTSQLRDTKGLRYLACLLRSPLTEFAAIALANDQTANIGNTATVTLSDFAENGIEIRSDLDGAAPALDLRARAEYRQRLADLKEEVEAAERHNDPGRKARLLSEIDALMKELKTRFGRGKDLNAPSNRERARSTVSKRIRFALDQIRKVNPALATHLMDSIRTGYNCVYRPKQKIDWNL